MIRHFGSGIVGPDTERQYAILRIFKNREGRENPHIMKTIILETLISANGNLKNSTNHAPSWRGFFLILLILVCFALCQQVQSAPDTPDPGPLPATNTADGHLALAGLTTGAYNSAFGIYSPLSLTDGNFCTGVGAGTLLSNTADENTATGAGALLSNIGGSSNTATGAFALFNNVGLAAPSKPTGVFVGSFNSANGDRALFSNTNGNSNTATGAGALTENTTGSANTAVGISALSQNTTADDNTAVGAVALFDNTTGTQNTAVGFSALHDNTEGRDNTANGLDALFSNTTGNFNTAIGESALASNSTGLDNTAIGDSALSNATAGSGNTALGVGAGANIATASNVISIGVSGEDVSNTAWVGNIYGVATQSGTTAPVVVSNDGQLGTIASSQRFKKDIAAMDKTSEIILSLRPVTFHYRSDANETPQFGLIAEEVAEVNPALVLPDKEGKPYTVRYDAVNAMLLNEFLKEHSTVEELKKEIATLTATVKEQAAQIQKVSAQLEAGRPATQMVNNP
jgi:hypothetical protein